MAAPFPICLDYLLDFFCELWSVEDQGFGFRVSGFGFRVSGFGFRVSGFGFRVPTIPSTSEFNSLTIVDPLGGNNTISMPLISQVNQAKPTVRLASVRPANVSTVANDQSSSSGLGYHVPIESVIDRNTQRVRMNPQPSLIPQSIPLEIHESSMDRNLNKSQIPASDKDTQIPIVISNSQIPSGSQNPASNIVFGSLNLVNPPKTAKRVVFNKGEPGMYWSPNETLELSKGFCQTLIGKCAY
ncbi:unnamed protein product, partial [Ilex paraguariensis]